MGNFLISNLIQLRELKADKELSNHWIDNRK
jgi:hypothetical protein